MLGYCGNLLAVIVGVARLIYVNSLFDGGAVTVIRNVKPASLSNSLRWLSRFGLWLMYADLVALCENVCGPIFVQQL